ncbi:MAG: glycosyltransferase [Ignavibacteria bacterium]|nr:glycosyltransferase [Ignavibacteria bacterium]
MSKINLLLVVCNNEFNGTERYVVDLAKNLNRNEFNIMVATPMTGPLSDILSKHKIKEVNYNNGKLFYYSIKGLYNLYKVMRSEKIDIVHANSKFQPCIPALLAGVNFKVETRHGIFYSQRQLNDLSLFRKIYEQIKQYFVDEFIATSENDKDTLIKYFKISPKKISVIYLGIDFDDISKRSNGTFKYKERDVNKNFIIGHIGRLTFQKAQEYLLQAFKLINDKYPDTRLVIVGKGENEEIHKKYAEENKLTDKIIFKGYINEIYREMQTFDVHVLTSRFEGTGYVNLEAMALGVPFISTNVGGATNFFTNEYDSLITNVEDPASTAKALEKLILDETFRRKIITNAFKTVRKYSVETMVNETALYYKKSLEKQ